MSARTGRPIRRLWRHSAQSIDWAPDSKRLVLTGRSGSRWSTSVYSVAASGRHLRRLSRDRSARESSAVWSPDGRWIAFARETRGKDMYIGDERVGFVERYAARAIRPSGRGERRVSQVWSGLHEEHRGPLLVSWQPRP
jgi:dipeptidyl aminopeptidase/acylaminoacyl peptidase